MRLGQCLHFKWAKSPICAVNWRPECGHVSAGSPVSGDVWSLRRRRFSFTRSALVASASIAPLCRKARYLDRSIATCSQVSVVVPKAFMLCLMMSLKHSFGPLASLTPWVSWPNRNCFGNRLSGIRTTCSAHRNWDLRIIVSIDGRRALSRTLMLVRLSDQWMCKMVRRHYCWKMYQSPETRWISGNSMLHRTVLR